MTHTGMRASAPRQRRHAPSKGSLAVLVLAFTLSACSLVPDFANPVAIYNNTFGNSGAGNSAANGGGDSATRTSQDYPRLSATATRPQAASAAERRRIVDGLVADRENARYIDQEGRGADAVRPALVAAEERAVPAVPQGRVQVAAVEPPQVREPARRNIQRRRDPAAPVPIEPRRRRVLAPVQDTVDSQARQDKVPVAVPVKTRPQDAAAAVRDLVDSRRLITTGREGGLLQDRALIPRRRTAVPSSIVRREGDSAAPRRVQRPATASVTQPRQAAPTTQVAPVTQVARLVEEPVLRPPSPAISPAAQPLETATPRLRAPAPTSTPLVVAQAQAQAEDRKRPRRRRTPVQAPSVALAPGENALSKIYSEMLAASASTVTTAPANPAFKPTTALPLPGKVLGVSPVVRESYNAAVDAATAPPTSPIVPPPTRIVESQSRNPARNPARSRLPARTERAPAPSQVAALVVPASPAPPPARRAALPQPFAVAPEPILIIKFANGSSRVTARDRTRLREIAARAGTGGGFIRVVGHASSRTRDLPLAEHNLINFGISLDRAHSVANQLMRQGVPPARIIVEARGDSDPIFFETMPEGEVENRRVEIFLDF